MLTLVFAVYNTIAYIYCQGRFKNWLISLFYLLSIMVLVSRIVYYSYVLNLYSLIDKEKGRITFDWDTMTFSADSELDDLVNTVCNIGIFFLSADYSKYALGFV